MRAEYTVDPRGGAGYGLIKIYDCDNLPEPVFALRRMTDGKYLSGNGWREGKVALEPLSSNAIENGMELHVGPNVVDELSPELHYQLEIPGLPILPLAVARPMQSWISEGGGAGLNPSGGDAQNPDDMIYEGVESTPVDNPAADVGNLPSGVAGAEDVSPDKTTRRRGCLFVGLLLFAVWIVGGWFLWQGAMRAPAAPTVDSVPFVLFPQSAANDEEPVEPENMGRENGAADEHTGKSDL